MNIGLVSWGYKVYLTFALSVDDADLIILGIFVSLDDIDLVG
jgi:hypothetical protein